MKALRQQITEDIRTWDDIADHRTGTEGDQATDDWLCNEIEAAGLVPEIEQFEFQRTRDNGCHLTVDQTSIEGIPCFDSAFSGRETFEGVLGREIPVFPLTPYDAHPLNQVFDEFRARRSLPAIAVSAAEGVLPGLALINAEHTRNPIGAPVLQVSSEHTSFLDTALGQPVRLHIDIERATGTAANIQTRVEGTNPEAPTWVIMTPKSSWWTSTAERAGGIVVWFALLRHFAGQPHESTLIFTANTGHELSHLGLDRFLEVQSELAETAGWIHLGANFIARGSEIRIQARDETDLGILQYALESRDIEVSHHTPTGTRPLGEARNVYDAGGRYVSILGTNPWFHQPTDRWPYTIDLDAAVRITDAFLALTGQLIR